MVSRRRADLRGRWRAEVIRSARISDSVRVVLLVLADEMTAAGYVSVPRRKIAETINRHEARVTERLTKAISAGFLSVVRAGRPGRTAEYCATLPDGAPVRTTDMVRSAGRVVVRTGAPPSEAQHGAPGWSTNTRALRPATRQRNDHERNDGDSPNPHSPKDSSDEEVAARSLLAAISPAQRARYAPTRRKSTA